MKNRFCFSVKIFQGKSEVSWIRVHTYSSQESFTAPSCAWFHLASLQEMGSLERPGGQWGYGSLSCALSKAH